MEGARERAYAIRDGILYAVVSSRMNQVNELKSAQPCGCKSAKRILTVVAATVGEGGEGDGGVGVKVVTMVTRWWRGDGDDEEEMKECGSSGCCRSRCDGGKVVRWWRGYGSGDDVVVVEWCDGEMAGWWRGDGGGSDEGGVEMA
ncbi:hypothetical protein Tco_0186335 [Tanacetum coccineum]